MTNKQRVWVYYGVGVPLSVLIMHGVVYLSGLILPKYWDMFIGLPSGICCAVLAIKYWAKFMLKNRYE
jgi:hypothetical protein